MVYLKIFIFVIFQFFSLKNYSKCYKYKDNNEKKINKINIKNVYNNKKKANKNINKDDDKDNKKEDDFTFNNLKNEKIDEIINKYGLKKYSEIIINILVGNFKWEEDKNSIGGAFTKYSINNIKNNKREKYGKNKRILRWLATTLSYIYLEQPNFNTLDEIQCYFYNNKIYISANNNEKTRKINYLYNNKNLIDVIKDFIKEKNVEFTKDDNKNVETDIDIRKNRHIIYLKNAIEKNIDNDIIKAINTNNIEFIIIDNKEINENLHCERKILEYLKKKFKINQLEYNNLGGIRRPCAICWNYLFSNLPSNSGILWNDEYSFINTEENLTISEFIDRFAKTTYFPSVCDCQSVDEDIVEK